jgi:hypothetical protein
MARAYSHQGHDPRVDKQAGYISATSAIHQIFSLANRSRSIHTVPAAAGLKAQSQFSGARPPGFVEQAAGVCRADPKSVEFEPLRPVESALARLRSRHSYVFSLRSIELANGPPTKHAALRVLDPLTQACYARALAHQLPGRFHDKHSTAQGRFALAGRLWRRDCHRHRSHGASSAPRPAVCRATVARRWVG